MNWHQHISVDANVCHGRACLSGTRIPVSVVLDNLAAGLTIDEILQSYPTLTSESIQAVLSYAAHLASERFVTVAAEA
ncbi:MAG: DUF433 domain-containing protein [Candidatus Hatepunaea meridiana]|nr:DUF433 domain-containing protein [Candidatus Hatepunaea meridiana]